MQIHTNIELIGNSYHVQISILKFSALELELMEQFGEPVIDIGGAFNGEVTRPGDIGQAVSYTLPTRAKRLKSDFPIKQIFDLVDDPNSDLKAKLFKDTIATRIADAKANLIAQSAPFTGESLNTI